MIPGGEQRIPALPREEWTDDARRVFGFWEGPEAFRNGSRSNVMMAMANHPALALPALELGRHVLVDSSLTEREKELIVLRIAWRFDCEHQWVHHVISARRIGMTDEEIGALASEDLSPLADTHDRAVVTATDQLSRTGRIEDAVWEELSEKLDRRGLMDLIYSIGFFAMNAWAMGAMQLAPEVDMSHSKSARDLLSR